MRGSKGVRVVAAGAALAMVLTPVVSGSAVATQQAALPQADSAELGLHLGVRPSEREIAALFDRWNAALATGRPEVVADLYAPGAVLLPTVSNRVRTDRAGVLDYFRTFLAKGPSGTVLESTTTVLDHNSALHNGIYRFSFKDGSTVDARFTYAYEKVKGRWLIVTHHSSALPEK